MQRLLLIVTTASYRAGAFLEAAGRLGVQVVVGSERPLALAAANPQGSLTLDPAAVGPAVRAVVEFAARHPIGAVVAADDDGVILAAAAAAALGLRHASVSAVAAARDKHRMREILAAAGIASPRFERVPIAGDPRDAARRVGFPCVLKPLALSASRGVMRADDEPQLMVAFARLASLLSRPEVAALGGAAARHMLLESYIPGVEVALEGLLSGGRLRVLALFDKPDPLEGPVFEETIYVTPSRLAIPAQQAIATATARVAGALGLDEGPIHAELRMNEQGPWMIEIAPRSIGGLCSRTLRFGAGISLEELILRHALGLEIESYERENLAAGVMMIPIPRAGVLRAASGQAQAREVAGVEEIRITVPIGQEVIPLPEGSRYLGFIFARGQTPESVEAALRAAHDRLAFDIAPPAAARGGGGATPEPQRRAQAW